MTAPELRVVEDQPRKATVKDLIRLNSFPTMIFRGEVGNAAELNKAVVKAVYADFEKDGSASSSDHARAVCWRSARNLHRNARYNGLRKELEAALAMISAELRYAKDYRLKITSMWANINPPGTSSPAACRPGNLWSGCYGVQVPDGTGSMKFIDPRTISVMNPPKYETDGKPRDCYTKITFKPRPGRIVIFPAWLYHEFEPNVAKDNGADGDYVYVSFNAVQARKKGG